MHACRPPVLLPHHTCILGPAPYLPLLYAYERDALISCTKDLIALVKGLTLGPVFVSPTASSDSSSVSESLPSLVQTAFPDASGFVRPGDKVSLKCIASGSPLPMVTWTLGE